MNIGFYGLLTWYFDNTIPNEFGYRLPPYFFLTADYWGIETGKRKGVEAREWLEKEKKKAGTSVIYPDRDEDAVKEEREHALNEDLWPAIKIVNLKKTFFANPFFKSTNDKVAVDNLCLTFKEGEV